jgi:hypothetical protein
MQDNKDIISNYRIHMISQFIITPKLILDTLKIFQLNRKNYYTCTDTQIKFEYFIEIYTIN